VFWWSQVNNRVLLAHFQKYGENVISASYSEVMLELVDATCRRYPGQLARGLLLHHDIARHHTAWATQEGIQDLQWEILEPYSSGLAPSDFPLFVPLKTILVANLLLITKRLKQVQKWLRQPPKGLCAAGFDALVKRSDKCISVGGCNEKYFFQVRISHVLHFISICDLFTDSLVYGRPMKQKIHENLEILLLTLKPTESGDKTWFLEIQTQNQKFVIFVIIMQV
jgi:hypothetical protein